MTVVLSEKYKKEISCDEFRKQSQNGKAEVTSPKKPLNLRR